MVTSNVKELLLFTFDGRKKNRKSKIVIHHYLPFVDEQRSVNCLLSLSFPPPPPPNFSPPHLQSQGKGPWGRGCALTCIVQYSLLAKRNRKGLLRRLTFLHLLICSRACVDLCVERELGKIKKDDMCTWTCQNGKCTYSNRKSSCYLREYAAYFYPNAKEPGLVIQQVILRFKF